MIINKTNLKALFTGYKAAFNQGFRGGEVYWQQVATRVPSTTKSEQYAWLGQFPKLREWVGDRHIKGMAAHDYTIKNQKFESTVAVPRDDIEDDTYGVFSPLMQEMGYAARVHPDELIFTLLANGFTETCYDGQYFFDTDHPVGGGTVSNLQTGTGNPWFLLDTRRALKPLIYQVRRDYDFRSITNLDDEHVFMRDEFVFGVDARVAAGFGFWQQAFGSEAALDAANFKVARQAMRSLKSDEGRPLGISPNLLVVGPSNADAAETLIKSEQVSDGTTTVSNILRNAVDVLVVPWLD